MAAAGHPRPGRSAPALIPPGVARVVGFVPLLCLAAHEWTRLSAPTHGSPARGLAWVVVALGAAGAVEGCARRAPGRRAAAAAAAVVGVLAAAALASGVDPVLLKPARWGELYAGLQSGAQALGVVRLPYSGADPWPQQTLDLAGAMMLALAGLLVAWPRSAGRGFPFFAWALLLTAVVTPVILLGGAQPVVLGLVLAILSILFLWLERMPLRPGIGLAVLTGIALGGALPLGVAADRPEAWFDYNAFAERLVPVHSLRFSWDQDYALLRWPRDGRELLRVKARRPAYWKAETLETFDGERWRAGGGPQAEDSRPAADMAASWRQHPAWTGTARVEIRNLASLSVVGPGTLLGVDRETRRVYPGVQAGSFVTASELRRGDSYRVRFHAPQPSRAELARAGTAGLGARANELTLHVPRSRAFPVKLRAGPGLTQRDPLPDADIAIPPFGSGASPRAVFPTLGRSGSGAAALRHSPYARTWALAQRLRRSARTPLDYVLAVDGFFKRGFIYTERPPRTARGRAPLDAFLFDSRAGYCQHFSGAMAMLLRMGGVPARVAAGFTSGEFQRSQGEWVVRDTDAHSWVEAWFAGIGWVTFDPTPPAAPARSQIAAIPAANGGGPGGQADQARADPHRGQAGRRQSQDAPAAPRGTATSGGGVLFASLFAVAAIVLAAAALWRRRWLASLSPETALERAVAELEIALRRSGHPVPTGITLAQLERRLRLDGEAAAYLRSLRAGRYDRDRPPPTSSQRRALRRQLAEGLGIRGRLRGLWALPPWFR